jgi:NAD(P)-dependent dehydrogenase (short-subunit alcohol dehydrogenase family)
MLVIFLLLVFHSFPTDGFSMTTERKTLLIAGSTGYIGKEVVRQAKRQGYHTVALVRNLDKIQEEFSGVDVVECDVTDPLQVLEVMESSSCVAVSLKNPET